MAGENSTIIEIDVQYKNNTGDGVKKTAKDLSQIGQIFKDADEKGKRVHNTVSSIGDEAAGAGKDVERISRAMDQANTASNRAGDSVKKIATTIGDLAKKTVTLPIRILDYATRPLRSIFNFVTSIKGVITGMLMGQAAQNLVAKPLALADDYSGALTGFTTLFKSEERGQQMMDDLDKFARTTPFKTSNVINQSQKMLAMGWDEENILRDMEIIGNAASATGKGDEGFGRIALALSQIKSKGKLSAEELNQLAEAGINAKAYIAEGLGFGTGDAALQKLSGKMANKSDPVMGNEALTALLAGMERDYAGMMTKLSKETTTGIRSNLEDTLEINVFRKWGQGLQEGAKRGLGAFADMLDENQEKLSAFGDQSRKVAATLSEQFANAAEFVSQKVLNITSSADFDQADLKGKFKMLWDGMIGDPLAEWWNGSGKQQVSDLSGKIGEGLGKGLKGGILALLGIQADGIVDEGLSIGKSFLDGFLEGFEPERIWEALKKGMGNVVSSGAKLLPGGEAPDAMSYLSGAAMLWGGTKAFGAVSPLVGGAKGLFGAVTQSNTMAKVTGMLGSKAGVTAGAAGTAKAAALGAGGVAGAIVGGVGLVSAINDLATAQKSYNEKESNVLGWSGAAKVGLVGAGTATGALLGSIVPVIGTAIGAAMGAGVGGLLALTTGGNIGQFMSDVVLGDGNGKIQKTTQRLQETVNEFERVKTKADLASVAMDGYFDATDQLRELTSVGLPINSDTQKLMDDAAQKQNEAARALMELYPDIISQYDIENGRLSEKLDLIRQINEAERNETRQKAQDAVFELEKALPKAEENLRAAKEKKGEYQTNYERSLEFRAKAQTMSLAWKEYLASGEYEAGSQKHQDLVEQSNALVNDPRYQNEWGSNLMGNFTASDFMDGTASTVSNEVAERYKNAREQQQEIIDREQATSGAGYEAQVKFALLPEDVNMQDMTAKMQEISTLKTTLEQLGASMEETRKKFFATDGNEKKTEADFQKSEEYQKISTEIETTTEKQKGLQAEVEKYLPQLTKVKEELVRINEMFDLIPDEKKIAVKNIITMVEDYEKGSQPIGDYVSESATKEFRVPGYAVGTNNAPPGYAWVGEKGPELLKFRGGEQVIPAERSKTFLGDQTRRLSWKLAEQNEKPSEASGQSRHSAPVNVGGVQVSIQIDGGEHPVEALREQLDEIGNELSSVIAVKVGRLFANMPLEVEGI